MSSPLSRRSQTSSLRYRNLDTCCSGYVASSCRTSPSTTTQHIMICESHYVSNNIGKRRDVWYKRQPERCANPKNRS
ncbi:hypothetical protein C7974DRAFT_345901 [Boeremia exigua]|uniref:uncharacterized protein n=1 Tax=Boeremia exigua TaxID=749465 RepID=UPI001E8E30EA|nr:uncharacterized protein C7974DRAFT_345901 [Boeremia exigua]KAH6612377.1 hypothetical protein C7974DRAFT_345901 [Boeremia exigua]